MLKISLPVTEYQEFDMDLADFSDYVKEIRFFPVSKVEHSWQRQKVDELTLFKESGPHHICGFVDVPASILPPLPKGEYWEEFGRKHIETIYNYLVKEGKTL